jgi:glutaconyl-CoA decarboxylase
MTVWDRIDYVVDPGTYCPLHTIFDPENEESGSTGVVDGLARIAGKWCVLIGFNNKWIAGAWIAGQAENNLRVTDLAKIMNLPLVWLVNCSGVKLPEQEKVYANRRGWRGSTERTRPAEAIRGSVRRSCSPIRTPISRWAAAASSAA